VGLRLHPLHAFSNRHSEICQRNCNISTKSKYTDKIYKIFHSYKESYDIFQQCIRKVWQKEEEEEEEDDEEGMKKDKEEEEE